MQRRFISLAMASTLVVGLAQPAAVLANVGETGAYVADDIGALINSTSDMLTSPLGRARTFQYGFELAAQLENDRRVDAGNSSTFKVHGIADNTPLTFVWKATSSFGWAINDGGFANYFVVGVRSNNAQGGYAMSFDGLSFFDNAPGAGNFAGTLTGGIGCSPGVVDSVCGTSWNGQGTRQFTLSETFNNADGSAPFWSEGAIYQNGWIRGTGADTSATLRVELLEVRAPQGTNPQAHLRFSDGAQFALTVATPVTEPHTYALLLAGIGLIGAITRRRHGPA